MSSDQPRGVAVNAGRRRGPARARRLLRRAERALTRPYSARASRRLDRLHALFTAGADEAPERRQA
jgi:hypothetical protein